MQGWNDCTASNLPTWWLHDFPFLLTPCQYTIAYLALFDILKCRNRQITQFSFEIKDMQHGSWQALLQRTRRQSPWRNFRKYQRRPLKQQSSEVKFYLRNFNQRTAWILYSCSFFTTINIISSLGHLVINNISRTLPGYTKKKVPDTHSGQAKNLV